jgi:phosphoadenosine phosphosulfate reductase
MAVAVAPDLEHLSAEDVLRYAVEHHPRLSVACSFQKEASVIMDMTLKIEPAVRFFSIDTGVLFDETYETWRTVERHYGIEVEHFDASRPGPGSWSGPELCCSERKVAALHRALQPSDAWVTGLRREHSPERAGTAKLHWDDKNGLWKLNPLADWSDRDVWRYIAENDVPYNPLHDRGYDSIGCAPCTLPATGRDGRWAGTARTECGLHA